jgi:AcrR family transcriptional regulator
MSIPDNVTSLDQVRPDGGWNDKKKERTRTQWLDAAVRLVGVRGIDNLSINDIAAEMAVAPGTFYNLFPSLQGLLEELAARVVAGLDESAALRARSREPGTRIALVLRADLRRAREEPHWGRLLCQFADRHDFAVRHALLRSLEDDVREGIVKGQFVAEADAAAQDFVIGSLLAGVRRICENGGHDVQFDRSLTANVLRGLGMVSASALERAQRGL